MGMFDFTYADNGDNIRGRCGYVYLSSQAAKIMNLPNPLPFINTNEYGDFNISIKSCQMNIDIYSLYTVLIDTDEKQISDNTARFIKLIKNRQFDKEYQTLNEQLRTKSINYFFNNIEHIANKITIIVPAIGNQKQKCITTHDIAWSETPLIISRKKLPVNTDTNLKNIAKTWGYVSTSDPNQGLLPTHNLYCRYLAI